LNELYFFIKINHFDELSRFQNTLKRSAYLDFSWIVTLCLTGSFDSGTRHRAAGVTVLPGQKCFV